MTSSARRTVSFQGPGQVEVRSEPMPVPSAHEVRVRTHLSGISPGTERLIYRGNAPTELPADATLSSMDGATLDFPLSYGYACVGTVDERGAEVSADWIGRRVFAFHPHTSAFTCAPDALVPLPDAVSDEAAVLVPSLETAVNFLMDGRPMIGESVVVFGQGIVGLLTTVLLAEHPLKTLVAVEPAAERRRWARRMGAHCTFSPDEMGAVREVLGVQSADAQEAEEAFEGADLAYEVSGHATALNDAVACTGFSGRIVVGSWYGADPVPLELGRRFHRSRIEFRSSQVSTIAPQDRGRWTKARRMHFVLSLLDEHPFEELVTHSYSVANAPQAYEDLAADKPSMLQPILRYH